MSQAWLKIDRPNDSDDGTKNENTKQIKSSLAHAHCEIGIAKIKARNSSHNKLAFFVSLSLVRSITL